MNSPDAHSEAVEEATVAVAVTVVAETTVAEIDEAALGKEDTRTVGCLGNFHLFSSNQRYWSIHSCCFLHRCIKAEVIVPADHLKLPMISN